MSEQTKPDAPGGTGADEVTAAGAATPEAPGGTKGRGPMAQLESDYAAAADARDAGQVEPEPGGEEPAGKGEDAIKDGEIDGLKPGAQEKVNRRIGEVTAKRKAAEAERDEARRQAEAAVAESAELRGRLDAVDATRAAREAGIPRVMLAESEAEIEERGRFLDDAEDALQEWLDGHDATDEYEEEDGGRKRTYSYAEVKQRIRQIGRERERVLPKAREMLRGRAEARTRAEKLYPEVLKAGTPERAEADRLLAAVPGLRVLPDWPVLVGRMIAGRKAEPGGGGGKPPAAEPGKPATPKPPPVAVPGAAGGRRIAPGAPKPGAFDEGRVRESGYSPDEVEKQYKAALVAG
jgi:hypothetical protein